jgi:hypothetical protein
VLIDYRTVANPYVMGTSSPARSRIRSRAIRAGAIYGGAGGIGYLAGGPAGAIAGIVMVPDIIAIPIILA